MEFTGTTAALNLLDRLLHGHGSDERVTQALDTRAFYIVPRVNPDGADAGLADRRFRRSSVRPYPTTSRKTGSTGNVDGDGRVLMMRLRDPNGSWKPHPDDAAPDRAPAGRLRRRVLPRVSRGHDSELGRRDRHDRARARRPRPEPELARRLGAGGRPARRRPYPRQSQKCARSSSRSSIGRTSRATSATTPSPACTCAPTRAARTRTSRPPTCERSSSWARSDRLTGYPSISIFHDFKYDPKLVIKGDIDWIYDFLGAFAWVTEFWSPQRQAGLADYHFIDWIRDHPPDDDRAILKLADEIGEGYVDWYRSSIRSSGPSSSAAGTSCASGSTRRSRACRRRSSRTPTSRCSSRRSRRGSRSDRSRQRPSARARTGFGS